MSYRVVLLILLAVWVGSMVSASAGAAAPLYPPMEPPMVGYHVIPFDAESMFRVQQRSWARAKATQAAMNHVLATVGAPGRTERLGQIEVPTLVIHGQNDPCLPVEHGIAPTNAILGARLVVIQGMGHLLPPSMSRQIARMVLEHIHRVSAGAP